MNTIRLTAFSLFLCLICFSNAQAGRTHLDPDNFKNNSPIRLCSEQHSAAINSSLILHNDDQKQIELARAFTAHLEKKGQDSRVIKSLFRASLKSHVDFETLLMKATLESDLGRLNVAAKSSARGVFQYIEPTWLVLMKRYGSEIGYKEYSDAISISRTGIPYFKGSNKYLRPEILALRYDTDVSALIKAHQIREETDLLKRYKGSNVTATDHYIAHMLGLSLAKDFYDMKRKNSIFAVAKLNKPAMREAAKLNRPFFYDGKMALTASQSYRKFEARVKRELQKIHAVSKTKPTPTCLAKAN